MKKIVLSIVASSTLLTTGCASLMTADEQTINVTTSNNEKVEVTVDDKNIVAPGMVTVIRDGKDKVIKTSNKSCDTATPIKKSVTPVFFGNLIIGGLLGSTTDGSTGKMWNYEDSVEISCSK